MQRHGLSEEDAKAKVDELKSRVRISLDNMIAKYGEEEGRHRWEVFKKKSAHTEKSFIKKYGELEGRAKYQEYLKTKDSRSLEALTRRYGEDEALERHKDIEERYKYSMSLDGFKEKHGEILGAKLYDEMRAAKMVTNVDFYMKQYDVSIDVAESMLEEANFNRGYKNTLMGYIDKFGEDIGTQKYYEKSKRVSYVYRELVNIYGVKDAEIRYKKYKEGDEGHKYVSIVKNGAPKHKNYTKGNVSKISKTFFSTLETSLKRKLQYGSRSKEVMLFDKNTAQTFFYDCYDEETNTLIELHGEIFHYNENSIKKSHVYGLDWGYVKMRDEIRISLAKENGYDIIVVWEHEVNCKTKLAIKVQELTELLKPLDLDL
jgi:hypothetical protein